MLVTLKHILQIAEAKQFAVGSFNTTGLECIEAVLGAAEELNVPVVLMHAQIHEEMGLCKLDTIGRVMRLMAERALVPVAVHLDHGTDLAYIHRALDLGFTSVMYDGSNLPYEENLANTCVAVELAARTGASVEAEIGSMGVRDCAPDDPPIFTPTPPPPSASPPPAASTPWPVRSARCTASTSNSRRSTSRASQRSTAWWIGRW